MSPLLTWEGPADEMPSFCPNGCGGVTEDPYGGPCQACWDAVSAPKGERPAVSQCCPMDTYDTDSAGNLRVTCSCGDGCECMCAGCACENWGEE